MLAANHAGNSRMQVRLELATVQVPPGLLLGVVVEQQCFCAVQARPRYSLRMLGPHVHPLTLDVQGHAAHGPWQLQAQQVLIERGVLHGRSLLGRPYYAVTLPTGNPEAPKQ